MGSGDTSHVGIARVTCPKSVTWESKTCWLCQEAANGVVEVVVNIQNVLLGKPVDVLVPRQRLPQVHCEVLWEGVSVPRKHVVDLVPERIEERPVVHLGQVVRVEMPENRWKLHRMHAPDRGIEGLPEMLQPQLHESRPWRRQHYRVAQAVHPPRALLPHHKTVLLHERREGP
eukprot:CAMPEP_0180224358 /NCGR_PEP_ID=MMETSP0987-20121128/22020_1 /TAXON_ID=697907 /ORGANISM="non described non described, Strain CCMP2293" /LENGTH=172 /DNA_ID=CAMNT_0022187145 /DNA_START=160 /DNA_END=678 /DNA_ORIENTATION=+